MTLEIALLVIAEALLVGMVLVFLLRSYPQLQPWRKSPEPPPPPPAFDAETAARRLLEDEPELTGLYERLGFSLDFERQGQELLAEIKAMVTVRVPDAGALRTALREARRRIREAASNLEPSAVERALAERLEDPLLGAAEKALASASREGADEGDAAEAVRQVLSRDPVDELLPVIEQMPYLRDGRVVWRTPLDVDVLEKRPEEPERFLRRLQQLESWVRGSRIRRSEAVRDAVLEASSRLRRAVEKRSGYVVTPLKALEESYADWYLQRQDPAAMARRRALDHLLVTLLRLRHELENPQQPQESTEEAAAAAVERRDDVAALASEYLRSPWLHTRRLALLLLATLLAAEAARFPLPKKTPRRGPLPLALQLRSIRDEVAAGLFDGEETLLRLRRLDRAGACLNSLVFGLLRQLGGGGETAEAGEA